MFAVRFLLLHNSKTQIDQMETDLSDYLSCFSVRRWQNCHTSSSMRSTKQYGINFTRGENLMKYVRLFGVGFARGNDHTYVTHTHTQEQYKILYNFICSLSYAAHNSMNIISNLVKTTIMKMKTITRNEEKRRNQNNSNTNSSEEETKPIYAKKALTAATDKA